MNSSPETAREGDVDVITCTLVDSKVVAGLDSSDSRYLVLPPLFFLLRGFRTVT